MLNVLAVIIRASEYFSALLLGEELPVSGNTQFLHQPREELCSVEGHKGDRKFLAKVKTNLSLVGEPA